MKAVAYVTKIIPMEMEVPDEIVKTVWAENEKDYYTEEYGNAVNALTRFIRKKYGIRYDDDYTCLEGEKNGEMVPILEY